MVLPHLRDPFRALASGSRLSRGEVVIVQQGTKAVDPTCISCRTRRRLADPLSWWYMSEGCVERMLSVLGFSVKSKTRAAHNCVVRRRHETCSTFVAARK